MIDPRNDYGFPCFPFERGDTSTDIFLIVRRAQEMIDVICGIPRQLTKLERAQAYAADVRARRGMVVRKGTST